jgi:hypothetical protein
MFMPEGNGYAPGAAPRKANDNRPVVHRMPETVIILEIIGLVAVDSGRPVAPAHENTPAARYRRHGPRFGSGPRRENCTHQLTPPNQR